MKVMSKMKTVDIDSALRTVRGIEAELRYKKAIGSLKNNGGKIPRHRWYKQEQFNYSAYGHNKGRVSGYFKCTNVTRGGLRKGDTYYKVHQSGFMVSINEPMAKIGVSQGITTPHNLQPSNKKEGNYIAIHPDLVKVRSSLK